MKEILKAYKLASLEQISSYCQPILVDGRMCGRLRPLTADTLQNDEEIAMLTAWRSASQEWFTSQFPVTEQGTRSWLQNQILDADDRILFFVEDADMTPVGQVGLLHYDEESKTCEFDNLLRGKKGRFGNIILYALFALGIWSVRELGLKTGYLNVLADNNRAIPIYHRLGFQEVKRVPLVRMTEGEITRWIPAEPTWQGEVEKYLVTMMVDPELFLSIYNQLQGQE